MEHFVSDSLVPSRDRLCYPSRVLGHRVKELFTCLVIILIITTGILFTRLLSFVVNRITHKAHICLNSHDLLLLWNLLEGLKTNAHTLVITVEITKYDRMSNID